MSEQSTQSQSQISVEEYEKLRPVMFIDARGKRVYFHVPNRMAAWRVTSLPTKEPVTLDWVGEMTADDVLFDVGANVGMYSIMAAGVCGARVVAFEPESQNYALLNLNIAANQLGERVTAFPVAVLNEDKLDHLYLSSLATAGSCHSFGDEVGFDLKARPAGFKQGSISTTIDAVVRSGIAPPPTHIKIDVDGFEHLVLAGAAESLANPRLRTVLVELNTNLPEHHAVFDLMAGHGFQYDSDQMEACLRRSGAFVGVGEVVFRRQRSVDAAAGSTDDAKPAAVPPTERIRQGPNYHRRFNLFLPNDGAARDVLRHVLTKLETAPIERDPFPYVVIDGIFPDDYYRRILEAFPDEESFIPLNETGRVDPNHYHERGIISFDDEGLRRIPSPRREFWRAFSEWMYSDLFISGFVSKFEEVLDYRLRRICADGAPLQVRSDALIVNDHTNYAIAPHTDAPHRLVSFLFYLPADESLKAFGTSFYRPKDPNLTCWGETHHTFEPFVRTGTIAFVPNRLVAFPKTERTFHGVERIEREGVARHLVINNIRILNPVTH